MWFLIDIKLISQTERTSYRGSKGAATRIVCYCLMESFEMLPMLCLSHS